MSTNGCRIALISDVFFSGDGEERLSSRLQEASREQAAVAVLPELALDEWIPATKEYRGHDAEDPGGRRHQVLSKAARSARIGLVGGAIVRDPISGGRRNTVLVFDETGALIGSYQKLHVPTHEGFWESSHYSAGTEAPRVLEGFGIRFGIQICSDVQRPEGSHMLGAMGADVIIAPRATCSSTYPRWRNVLIANAITSTTYIISVNRPRPEKGVDLGGPSIAIDPRGEVTVESSSPVTVFTLEKEIVEKARREYPGDLAIQAAVYSSGWMTVAGGLNSPLKHQSFATSCVRPLEKEIDDHAECEEKRMGS